MAKKLFDRALFAFADDGQHGTQEPEKDIHEDEGSQSRLILASIVCKDYRFPELNYQVGVIDMKLPFFLGSQVYGRSLEGPPQT